MSRTEMRGLDLTLRRFGRLVAIGPICTINRGRLWFCKCDCGNYLTLVTGNLTSGNSSSCGCLKREITASKNYRHGFAKRGENAEYAAFVNAQKRCNDPSNKRYKDYGGRGIRFLIPSCRELIDSIGKRPSNHYSLDRINNEGDYEVGNLRWATRSQQQQNRRGNAH